MSDWAFFLSFVGFVAAILLFERYALDQILDGIRDWWQRDQIQAKADALARLKADMETERLKRSLRDDDRAVRRMLEIVSRTGSQR